MHMVQAESWSFSNIEIGIAIGIAFGNITSFFP